MESGEEEEAEEEEEGGHYQKRHLVIIAKARPRHVNGQRHCHPTLPFTCVALFSRKRRRRWGVESEGGKTEEQEGEEL